MKIAYISPNFPPESGGMGTSCHYLANKVGKSQEVTVFLPARRSLGEGGANRKKEYTTGNYKIKLFKPWLSFGYADFAPQIVKLTKNFDIVHIYYPCYGTAEFLLLRNLLRKALRTSKKPKNIIHHNMDVVGGGVVKFVSTIHRYTIQPLLFKLADAIFVLSKDYAENSDITKTYKKNPGKFYIVPHGVDINKFKNLQPTTYNLQPNFTIFTAQGLDKQHFFKGIDVLIRSINLLITHYSLPITLNIAGDGNLKSYYENLVNKLGVQDNVKFLGHINQNDLPKYYSQSDITVIPSTASTECFSIVAVEAMASGKPAIVSDWPGLRATIKENETGLICEPNNVQNLAEKIKYFYDNPAITKTMGEKARERVEEKYDWKKISEKAITYYKKTL